MLWITWSSRILKWRCAKLKVGEFSATLPTLFWMTTNSDQHKSFKLVLCLVSFYYESVEQTIIDQFWKKSPLEKTRGPFETWKKQSKYRGDPLRNWTIKYIWKQIKNIWIQMRLCQCMFKNEIFEYRISLNKVRGH